MKFKSQIFTQVSGSIGGITFFQGRSGMTARARAIPTDPNTAQQIVVRGALAALATRWGSVLTAAQRAAWDVYAANVSMVNPLGDQINLSGINQYVRSNTELHVAGATLVDAAPTVFDVGNDTNAWLMTCSVAAQQCSLTWPLPAPAWFGEDDSWCNVYVSRPQNPGINFFRGPYRFGANIEGNTAVPLVGPQVFAVPFPFVIDQKIFARVTVVRADGRRTTPLFMSTTTVA